MKTLNEMHPKKSGWIISLAVAVATSGFVFAIDPPGSYPESEFKQENADIRKDIKGITLNKKKVETLQAKLEKNKASKDVTMSLATMKDLSKAKADLKREKAYLRADKKDLKRDHYYTVCKSKQEVRKEKFELQASKAQMRKNLRENNAVALKSDMREIEKNQKELNSYLTVLENKKMAMKTELAAVNKELVDAGIRNELVIFEEKPMKILKAEETVEPRENKAKAKAEDESTASADEGREVIDPRWMK